MKDNRVEVQAVLQAVQRGTPSVSAPDEAFKRVVRMNPALLSLSKARSVLLLQGPLGPFFDRLTAWLTGRGTTVNRVVFQGGDLHDCKSLAPIRFTAPLAQWPEFLAKQLQLLQVDHIVLFGQSRAYHEQARRIAAELNVQVVVFEEGYFRPGFATMELGGVNGYSTTLQHYRWAQNDSEHLQWTDIQPDISPKHFQKMAWHASQHYLTMHHMRGDFPHYQHHKQRNPYWYARYWVWSWMKKFWFQKGDRLVQIRLIGGSRPYFFVPLQHDGDAQITHHSCFSQNTDFIIQVMRSFCLSAPSDTLLVFRQHPFSRGGSGHAQFIRSMALELGISHRVIHMVEGDTPLLAQHSAGVVLINSTVGLQALERNAPLMVLGEALYKRPNICFQGGLDLFWNNAQKPDQVAVRLFLGQLKNLTQVSVSLYANREEPLVWSSYFPE